MLKHETASKHSTAREIMTTLLEKAKIPTLPMVAQKLVELCRDEKAVFDL